MANNDKFKMEENDTIGILNGYEYDELCSVGSLRNHIKNEGTVYTATQYCDGRFNTDLRRFSFDPYTGKKIDWKEVRKIIEQ